MGNPELNEIIESLQAAISRAYALGRLDALKHVITAMEAEEASVPEAKPLALTGPQPGEAPDWSLVTPSREEAAPKEASAVQLHQDMPANDDGVTDPVAEPERLPWYRRTAL